VSRNHSTAGSPGGGFFSNTWMTASRVHVVEDRVEYRKNGAAHLRRCVSDRRFRGAKNGRFRKETESVQFDRDVMLRPTASPLLNGMIVERYDRQKYLATSVRHLSDGRRLVKVLRIESLSVTARNERGRADLDPPEDGGGSAERVTEETLVLGRDGRIEEVRDRRVVKNTVDWKDEGRWGDSRISIGRSAPSIAWSRRPRRRVRSRPRSRTGMRASSRAR
jgi:hypothetical protein